MNQYQQQQSIPVAMSPRTGVSIGGPQQMQQVQQGQQQQQQQQSGGPGSGMGRGASSTGLQNSALPLNPIHQVGPNPSQQSMQDDMGGQEGGVSGQLDIYIYDYLRRNGFYQAARGLMHEARLFKDSSPNQDSDAQSQQRRAATLKRSHSGLDNRPNSSPNDKSNGKSPGSRSNSPHHDSIDLPDANLPKSGEQGLLKGWWSVFWDIYAARNGYGGSAYAYQFLDAMVLTVIVVIAHFSAIKVECLKLKDNLVLEFRRVRKCSTESRTTWTRSP